MKEALGCPGLECLLYKGCRVHFAVLDALDSEGAPLKHPDVNMMCMLSEYMSGKSYRPAYQHFTLVQKELCTCKAGFYDQIHQKGFHLI